MSDLLFTKIFTNCTFDKAETMTAKTFGISSNLPGQSFLLCGHAIQVDF